MNYPDYCIIHNQQIIWIRRVNATPKETLEKAWEHFTKAYPTGYMQLLQTTCDTAGLKEIVIKQREN